MNRFQTTGCLVASMFLFGLHAQAGASQGNFTLDGATQDFAEVSAFRIRDRSDVQSFNTYVMLTKTVPDREAIARGQ